MNRVDERQLLLALCGVRGVRWDLVAREAQRPGGLDRMERAARVMPLEPWSSGQPLNKPPSFGWNGAATTVIFPAVTQALRYVIL